MSTHNIGFYEDLTKIIFELSSNIIKYAPYFFCWKDVAAQRYDCIYAICICFSEIQCLINVITLYKCMVFMAVGINLFRLLAFRIFKPDKTETHTGFQR